MTVATHVPSEYKYVKRGDQPAVFSGEAVPVKSTLCLATAENGWTLTRYETASQEAENRADIQDSLQSLKEGPGISLDDLKRDLGV